MYRVFLLIAIFTYGSAAPYGAVNVQNSFSGQQDQLLGQQQVFGQQQQQQPFGQQQLSSTAFLQNDDSDTVDNAGSGYAFFKKQQIESRPFIQAPILNQDLSAYTKSSAFTQQPFQTQILGSNKDLLTVGGYGQQQQQQDLQPIVPQQEFSGYGQVQRKVLPQRESSGYGQVQQKVFPQQQLSGYGQGQQQDVEQDLQQFLPQQQQQQFSGYGQVQRKVLPQRESSGYGHVQQKVFPQQQLSGYGQGQQQDVEQDLQQFVPQQQQQFSGYGQVQRKVLPQQESSGYGQVQQKVFPQQQLSGYGQGQQQDVQQDLQQFLPQQQQQQQQFSGYGQVQRKFLPQQDLSGYGQIQQQDLRSNILPQQILLPRSNLNRQQNTLDGYGSQVQDLSFLQKPRQIMSIDQKSFNIGSSYGGQGQQQIPSGFGMQSNQQNDMDSTGTGLFMPSEGSGQRVISQSPQRFGGGGYQQ